MDTGHSNPANFSFQKNNSSGVLLGSTANNVPLHTPMYNSFFLGANQPAYGYHQPPGFLYRERKGKVNWRNISNLDIDDLIGRGDVRALETYLSNITFANIEKEDLEKFGDATLLKLFRLSQYGLEYLLNSQNYLANQAYLLDNQYKLSEDKMRPIEELARRNHSEISNLKTEIKQKKDLIKTYKKALNKPVFKCHLCSKYFQSSEFLDAHFKRRHPQSPEAEKIVVVKEIVTSQPIPQTKETNVKAAGRYKKSYEDEDLDNQCRVESTAIQTTSTNDNTMQMQSSLYFERLLHQFKEDEDMKLSQLNLTLQEKLQEIIRSNKELTSKVIDLEKKVENQSFVSVKEPETFQRTMKVSDTVRTTNEESIKEFQKKETPKKPVVKSRQDLDPIRETIEKEPTKKIVQEVHPVKEFVHEPQMFQHTLIQQENTVVYRLEVPESQRKKSDVTSLEHITEEKKQTPPVIEQQISPTVINAKKQQFHASSLRDVPEEKEKEKEIEREKSIRSSDILKSRQVFRSGDLEDLRDEENVVKTSSSTVFKKAEHQVFRSSALESIQELDAKESETKVAKGVNSYNSRLLEDDDDSQVVKKSRKKSQEDFVIVEKNEEEELTPDEVREKHMKAGNKAEKAIKNKYLKEYKPKKEQAARAQIQKEMNNFCEKKFGIPASQLPEQRTEKLEDILASLKVMNKQDSKIVQNLLNEHKNHQQNVSPANNQRSSQESGFKESPKITNFPPLKSTNIPMESAELRNLLMNPEISKKDVISSQDPLSGRKQVFDSQKLEQHLLSVDDFKPSNFGQKGNVRESGGNLIKKSIETGFVEQI